MIPVRRLNKYNLKLFSVRERAWFNGLRSKADYVGHALPLRWLLSFFSAGSNLLFLLAVNRKYKLEAFVCARAAQDLLNAAPRRRYRPVIRQDSVRP